MTEDIFDQINAHLSGKGDNESPSSDSPSLSPLASIVESHPFISTDADGVPDVLTTILSSFFPSEEWKILRDESIIASRDLHDAIRLMDDRKSPGVFVSKILTGTSDPEEGLKFIARLVTASGLLAALSIYKATGNIGDERFTGVIDTRIAMMAGQMLGVARVLSATIRAENHEIREEKNRDQ